MVPVVGVAAAVHKNGHTTQGAAVDLDTPTEGLYRREYPTNLKRTGRLTENLVLVPTLGLKPNNIYTSCDVVVGSSQSTPGD